MTADSAPGSRRSTEHGSRTRASTPSATSSPPGSGCSAAGRVSAVPDSSFLPVSEQPLGLGLHRNLQREPRTITQCYIDIRLRWRKGNHLIQRRYASFTCNAADNYVWQRIFTGMPPWGRRMCWAGTLFLPPPQVACAIIT